MRAVLVVLTALATTTTLAPVAEAAHHKRPTITCGRTIATHKPACFPVRSR